MSEGDGAREAVAVVLPFFGDAAEADAALASLAGLSTGPGDELVLADNTDAGIAAGREAPAEVRVVECEVKRSAYAARNIGAEATAAPWLLFVDADCVLPPDLPGRYFEPAPGPRAGAVAGEVRGDPDQHGRVARYVRSRGHLDQRWQVNHPYRPMAVTANLLVRRAAWAEVGGFAELTRSGADADFSWRLQDAGWELEYRAEAAVLHRHRDTLRELLRQARRDGSAAPWLARRHAGYPAHAPWSALPRALAGALAWPLAGQPERGLFKALDGAWSAAFNVGALVDDAAGEFAASPASAVLLIEEFPVAGDPVVEAAATAGERLRVEALRRPEHGDWTTGRRVAARHWEDDNALTRMRGLARARTAAPRLAAAAARLRSAPHGTTVLAEPALVETAGRLAALARRPDLRVDALPADRAAAADLVRTYPGVP